MRLFVSYARVDKPHCLSIVGMLQEAHEVWYDHRIRIGQDWWKIIQDQIHACDGFIYLISPESLASEYCGKELELAQTLGKTVFPVLIHPDAILPIKIKERHYGDFSKGVTPQAVSSLLNAVHLAERELWNAPKPEAPSPNGHKIGKGASSPGDAVKPSPTHTKERVLPFRVDPQNLFTDVMAAMDVGNYDHAVFMLTLAKESECDIRFIDLDEVLIRAESLLERQTYLREADRQYKPIVILVKGVDSEMRLSGCKSFLKFRQRFPDYDPEHLAQICMADLLPTLEWCEVPPGEVTIEYDTKQVIYYVDAFKISKYPITNAQFQTFVDAKDGYQSAQWWDFSPHAKRWHKGHVHPAKPKFLWGDHPRARVSWYEAIAFCRWFNAHNMGYFITLPTEQQWQRAAQGDDNRVYPWGNRFDPNRCHSKSAGIRMTCAVTAYPGGVSPHGVCDMSGNVWEWCVNTNYTDTLKSTKNVDKARAVRGGAFISGPQRLKTTFHYYLPPEYRYPTIGFRVAITKQNGCP